MQISVTLLAIAICTIFEDVVSKVKDSQWCYHSQCVKWKVDGR